MNTVKGKTSNIGLHGQTTTGYSSIFECASLTFKSEGFFGFYKGFIPCWMRIGPHTIVTFMILEKLRNICGIRPI